MRKQSKFGARLVSSLLVLCMTLTSFAPIGGIAYADDSASSVQSSSVMSVDSGTAVQSDSTTSDSTVSSTSSEQSVVTSDSTPSSSDTADSSDSQAANSDSSVPADSTPASESTNPDSGSASASSDSTSTPTSDASSDSSSNSSSSDSTLDDSSGTTDDESTAGEDASEAESADSDEENAEDAAEDEEAADEELTEEGTEDDFVALVVNDPESGDTVEAEVGESVTFNATVNRDDVAVSYQWQKMFTGQKGEDYSSNVIHEYAEGERTWYNYLIADKSEADTLKDNPSATWGGIELYYAIVDALDSIGADSTNVSVVWHTPNYALDGYLISAETAADGVVEIHAEKDGELHTGRVNADGEWEFTDAEANTVVEESWENIEGATDASYTFTVSEDDYETIYRCQIEVVDEAYKAKAMEMLAEQGVELTEEQKAEPQYLYSIAMRVHSDTWDAMQQEPQMLFAAGTLSLNSMVSMMSVATNTPRLSSDGQWIEGLNSNYEYITKDTYDRVQQWLKENKIDSTQADRYWTRFLSGGFSQATYANELDENGFPTGNTRLYSGFTLVNGDMLEVNSEWYGKTVYFRPHGSQGTGTAIKIPAYTDLTIDDDGNYVESSAGSKYKKAITVLNPFVADVGSVYYTYISTATQNGWLVDSNAPDVHITVYDIPVETFNSDPARFLVDAEGNYRMDSVAWGVCIGEEPDLSGKAYWLLKDYIANGYGLIVGHDTMYAYAGSYYDAYGTDMSESSIDPNDGSTWYYSVNSWQPVASDKKGNYSKERGGHFYMNQLMGSNKGNVYSGTVTPSDAPSKILSTGGSHGQYGKEIQFGSDTLKVLMNGYSMQEALDTPKYRTPTNYPYFFQEGRTNIKTNKTHTNQQAAFGTIWLNYYGNNIYGVEYGYEETPRTWSIDGKTGTNNFYLAGDGNFLMNQVGHLKYASATIDEAYIFANSVMYVSQRKQCEICAANQDGQQTAHFVRRINSANAEEVLTALQNGGTYWYPLDGCYMLTDDITLPEDWTPIEHFNGHWNSDVYDVTLNSKGTPLLANDSADGTSGWNLGTDQSKGTENVFDGDMNRVTGVARVVGDLNDLFGTEMNYAGYTVKILGDDNTRHMSAGEEYSCTVNSDSKYVISNLPCIYDTVNKTGVLNVRVYDKSGKEVTEYGGIYVNVDKDFWNNDMTIPLYLGSFSAEPIVDMTTYEAAQAVFSAEASSDKKMTVSWEYRESDDDTWKAIPTTWEKTVNTQNSPSDIGFKAVSTIRIDNVNPAWDGYEFRAVFTNDYGSWSTYDYYWTAGRVSLTSFSGAKYMQVNEPYKTGKLTVLLWPAYAEQGEDKEAYEGRSATFTSAGYALASGSTPIEATWQYSTEKFNSLTGKVELEWHDISGSNEFGGIEVVTTNSPVRTVVEDVWRSLRMLPQPMDEALFEQTATFYRVETSLTVNKVDISQSGIHFRVHYTAQSSYGTQYDWYSDIANDYEGCWTERDAGFGMLMKKENNSNILTVIRPDLDVVTTPSASFTAGQATVDTMTPDEYGQLLVIPTTSTSGNAVADGQASYQAVIYYKPGDLTPTPSWQYMTYMNRTAKTWNQSAANALGLSVKVGVKNENLGLVTQGQYTGYMAIRSTMTLSNVPLSMYNSENFTKYYFRCIAGAQYTTVRETKSLLQTDKWGGLAMDYAIDIQHNGVNTYGGKNTINGVSVTDATGIASATSGKTYSEWKYPNLAIRTPNDRHVNTVIVSFEPGANANDTIVYDAAALGNLGITVSQASAQELILVSTTKDAVATTTWNTALRNYVYFRTYDKADYSADKVAAGTTGGAKVRWFVDESRLAGVHVDTNTGHAYKVVTTTQSIGWDDANAAAKGYNSDLGLNGYLADITSAAENTLVQSLTGNKEAWIGGYNSGGWKWSSGASWTYSNWASGTAQNKSYLFMRTDGKWEDTNGTSATPKTYNIKNLIGPRYTYMQPNSDADNNRLYIPYPGTGFYSSYVNGGGGTGIRGRFMWMSPYPGAAPGMTSWRPTNFFTTEVDGNSDFFLGAISFNAGSDTTPCSIKPRGWANFSIGQYEVEANKVYVSNDVTLQAGHVYYFQAIVDSYGDCNGQLEGGVLDANGNWLCQWVQGYDGSGGQYQNLQQLFSPSTTITGAAVFHHTGNIANCSNPLMSETAQLYNMALIDLTATFGSDLNQIITQAGYGLDGNSIVNFVNDQINSKGMFYRDGGNALYGGVYESVQATFYAQEIKNMYAYVVEYDIPSLAFAITNHSAEDTDIIGTQVSGPEHSEKIVSVFISGNEKVYDGTAIVPSSFFVTGALGANESLFEITYKAKGNNPYANYTTTTVSGTSWKNTGAINAEVYEASVRLTTAAQNAGWKLDSNSQTECELVIYQRPVNVYSYNNDRTYDRTSAGVIKNIRAEAATSTTGIVTGDTVSFNTTTVYGMYIDGEGYLTVHNSMTNNSGKEWTMYRNETLSDLYIVHTSTSDPYHNYVLGTETYTGDILQRGLTVHSLYLEDPQNPRNVKTYDGTTSAVIKDILIDNVVAGDNIGLKEETMTGHYETANAGERLNSDGTAQSDRLKKLDENIITADTKAQLTGNDFGDYVIVKEEYSGAICRAALTGQVMGDRVMYGVGLDETPWHDTVPYEANKAASEGCWLTIDGLVGKDTLLLDYDKSHFEMQNVGDPTMQITEETPVGKYALTYVGMNEANYPVLSNYITAILDGTIEVYPREIRITVEDDDRHVSNTELPNTHSTFEMLNNDEETYSLIGSDADMTYEEMALLNGETVQSTILVKEQGMSRTTPLTMEGANNTVDYNDNGIRSTIYQHGTSIPYASDWFMGAPAKYLDLENDYELHDCEWCEEYYGFTLGTDHWSLDSYEVRVNQDNSRGRTLDIAYVYNPMGERVQNYTLTYVNGKLFVHPELRFQLNATVPMYVCMYGYNGDGEVVEPTEYGITNYSNGPIKVTDINVSQSGWNITDKAPLELQRGEMSMKMKDTQLVTGSNAPANQEEWVIKGGEEENGVKLNIPMTCYIAGGNVNDAEETFVTKVTYTIAEYGITVPEVEGVELPDIINGEPVTVIPAE